MSKHGGCFYCGGGADEILVSLQKEITYANGRKDVVGVALCSVCQKCSEIDLRVKPQQVTA